MFLSLKNYYAQRIYDLLRLWSGTKNIINYSIEDIKKYLMLENQYPEYGNFKRRVIIPAINDLNSSGCFDIDIVENKVGRKVESIDFVVKDLDRRIYFDKKDKELHDKNITELKTKEEERIVGTENKVNEFYVPNRKLFTSKTLSDFMRDFKDYDFKDEKYKKVLRESVLIALEKDDEEKIKAKSYNYFKKTLENKIDTLVSKQIETEDKVFKKTKFHNFDESYTNYSQEELDELILKSQKKKYNDR